MVRLAVPDPHGASCCGRRAIAPPFLFPFLPFFPPSQTFGRRICWCGVRLLCVGRTMTSLLSLLLLFFLSPPSFSSSPSPQIRRQNGLLVRSRRASLDELRHTSAIENGSMASVFPPPSLSSFFSPLPSLAETALSKG